MTEFRAMRPGEEAAVMALWDACGLCRPWNPPRADLALARRSSHTEILVAADKELFATVMVGEDGHRAWVYYLAVAPERRGQGWGRRAMAAAEGWARARGVPKMLLMVRNSNDGAGAFYAGLGYEDARTATLGKWLDPARQAIADAHETD